MAVTGEPASPCPAPAGWPPAPLLRAPARRPPQPSHRAPPCSRSWRSAPSGFHTGCSPAGKALSTSDIDPPARAGDSHYSVGEGPPRALSVAPWRGRCGRGTRSLHPVPAPPAQACPSGFPSGFLSSPRLPVPAPPPPRPHARGLEAHGGDASRAGGPGDPGLLRGPAWSLRGHQPYQVTLEGWLRWAGALGGRRPAWTPGGLLCSVPSRIPRARWEATPSVLHSSGSFYRTGTRSRAGPVPSQLMGCLWEKK